MGRWAYFVIVNYILNLIYTLFIYQLLQGNYSDKIYIVYIFWTSIIVIINIGFIILIQLLFKKFIKSILVLIIIELALIGILPFYI